MMASLICLLCLISSPIEADGTTTNMAMEWMGGNMSSSFTPNEEYVVVSPSRYGLDLDLGYWHFF